jgi:hypothetical protein
MRKKLISGILVTMFLATLITAGFPARVSAQSVGTVKIGIVGPKGSIQWYGLWWAAQIARDMINKAAEFSTMPGPKGMLVYDPNNPAGALAQVQLVDIDECSFPILDPATAVAALLAKLEANPDMQFLIGGFRTECVAPMEEAAMDYAAVHHRPVWLIAGAATGSLISVVQSNYARYKYMFRVSPTNSTMLFGTFLFGIIQQLIAPKLAALYYRDPTHKVPTYVIAENLVWCDIMVLGIQTYAASAGLDYKGSSRPSPTATDFSAEIAAATAAGAKLVIHIFSGVGGANFIKQYGALKPKWACVGINVESQQQAFYASVNGACEYETFLASVGTQAGLPNAESMNPNAKPVTSNVLWNLYQARYGNAPIYPSWGAYDAIISLNETSYDPVGSGHPSAGKGWSVETYNLNATNVAKWTQHMESLGVSDGFAWKRVQIPETGSRYYRNGILGLFSYTGVNGNLHDPFCTVYSFLPLSDRVTRAVIVQWQAGRMEVVWPRDQPYSRKWMFPPWMYSLETDIAGGPLINTGIGNFNYTSPDGVVDVRDLAVIAYLWYQKPTFNLLEADMQPQNHTHYIIDGYEQGRVGRDWLKTAIPQ